MVVAVVIAAATMAAPVAAVWNPEHALHSSHRAADAGADRPANHTAHRAGNPVAFPGAFLRTAHDALRMRDLGNRKQRESDGGYCKIKPNGQADWQCRYHGLRRHLNSSWSAAMSRRPCNLQLRCG